MTETVSAGAHAPAAGRPPGTSWERFASCRYDDPDLWHSGEAEDQAEAKRICQACPVRAPCLEDALGTEGNATKSNRFGIVGGLGPAERRKRYEQRAKQKPVTV